MIKSLGICLAIFVISLLLASVVSDEVNFIWGLPNLIGTALIIFLIQWLAFIPAFIFQTEKFYDLVGSATYISAVAINLSHSNNLDLRSIIIASCIMIWALRLGSFLVLRVLQDRGDGRFDKIKPNFGRFFMAWTMQGLWVFLTASCVLTALGSSNSVAMSYLGYLGLAVWAIGFFIEVVADAQKRIFRVDPDKVTPFITSGLWTYSRHPNYFGEIILWLGISIIALPVLSDWQFLSLVSPIFVYFLLTKISGIPLLEQRSDSQWNDRQDYIDYRDSTPVLFPKLKK